MLPGPDPAPPRPSLRDRLRLLLPLLVCLGILAWLGGSRWQAAQRPEPLLVALAEAEPPAVSFSEDLPAAADGAILSLARGDCLTAAAGFRTARRGAPDVGRLWALEGAAFVCAGQPAEAREVLEQAAARPDPHRQLWWFLAQACLLQGDAACAAEALDRAVEQDGRHRRRAELQQARLREARARLSAR